MRASGVLLPISSLPGKYGIGRFSAEAYAFVDFLHAAGQRYWQVLPVCPTGYGDSPYQSFSTFAGNPYFIDPEALVRDGLLTEEELASADFGSDPGRVDYGRQYIETNRLLDLAAERGLGRLAAADKETEISGNPEKVSVCPGGEAARDCDVRERDFPESAACAEFRRRNAYWLEDYALFTACKKAFGGKSFTEWDEDIRRRAPRALERYRQELSDEISKCCYLQFLFDRQWMRLKACANEKGIRIIGDIPIYVAPDSADFWAHPELFQVNADGGPSAVAGCPPDGFSADGQFWGNPLYDWVYHRETGYAWWISRLTRCRELYDVIRIDHFRGFDEYYSIPAGETTAVHGSWKKGPGAELFRAAREAIGETPIIAEDLGYITDSVRQLVKDCGFPNMKVLEFAFDSRDSSSRELYLPHNYEENCVVYTGTHDNETLLGWLGSILPEELQQVREYLGCTEEESAAADPAAGEACSTHGEVPQRCTALKEIDSEWMDAWKRAYRNAPPHDAEKLTDRLIRLAQASVADLCVIPMQDWLGLDNTARMNRPNTMGGNWQWRMQAGDCSEKLAERMRKMARMYGRT